MEAFVLMNHGTWIQNIMTDLVHNTIDAKITTLEYHCENNLHEPENKTCVATCPSGTL